MSQLVLEEKYHIGMGVLATILLVYLVGLVVSNFLGQKLLGAGEKILTKIPLVREVYAPVKQVVQMALMTSSSTKFSRAVAIKTPGSTIRVIGFVTGEFHEEGNPAPSRLLFLSQLVQIRQQALCSSAIQKSFMRQT